MEGVVRDFWPFQLSRAAASFNPGLQRVILLLLTHVYNLNELLLRGCMGKITLRSHALSTCIPLTWVMAILQVCMHFILNDSLKYHWFFISGDQVQGCSGLGSWEAFISWGGGGGTSQSPWSESEGEWCAGELDH